MRAVRPLTLLLGAFVFIAVVNEPRAADDLPELLKRYTASRERLLPIGAQRLPSADAFEELGAELKVIVATQSSFATDFVMRELVGSELARPRLAAVAARALLHSPNADAFAFLVKSFTRRAPDVQVEILQAYAKTKRETVLFAADLVKALRRPLSFEVKVHVPAALARHGHVVIPALLLGHAAIPQLSEEVRLEERYREAVIVSLRKGSRATKAWLASTAFERTPVGSPGRTLLIELCGALSLVAAESKLEVEVSSGPPDHAASAAAALVRMRVDPERIAAQVRGRNDIRDVRLARAGRLRATAEPRSPADLALLRDSLRSENPFYALLAILGVRRSGNEAASALVEPLDHADAGVREASWQAIVSLRKKSTIGPLVEQLDLSSSERRGRVLDLLKDLTRKNLGDDSAPWRSFWTAARDSFDVPPPGRVSSTVVEAHGLRYFVIEVIEGRLLFLIDVSYSMKGDKIAALRRELSRLLRSLSGRSEINIVSFESNVHSWRGGLTRLVGGARRDALDYLREVEPGKGTNISDVLEYALSHDRVDAIYLLSDGRPTTGSATGTEKIIRLVRRKNKRRGVRIHTIAFGSDSELLRRLAAGNRGNYRYVTSFTEEDRK